MKKQAEPRFLRYNDINSKAGTEKAALGRGGSDGVTMQVTPGLHSEYSNSAVNTHCYRAAPNTRGSEMMLSVCLCSVCKLCSHSIQVS